MPEVRLLEYAVQKDVVMIDAETGIIEVPREPGRLGRYLRTDSFDDEGRRLYGLIGTVTDPSPGCPTCRDPWDVYQHSLADRVASDEGRHALLLRCRDCESLFEVFPEEREAPRRISDAEARMAFPGAL